MKNKVYNTQFNTLLYLPISFVSKNVEFVINKCQQQKVKVINLVIDNFDDIERNWEIINTIKKSHISVMIGFKFISNKTVSNSNWNAMVILKKCAKKALLVVHDILSNMNGNVEIEHIVNKLSNFDYLLIPFYSINNVGEIDKKNIFLDINDGIYVKVAEILKHMVFNSVGNAFKKKQDIIGMLNEMMYPYLPKNDGEVHYLLHRVITIFSYLFNTTSYFNNVVQFKRFPNAIGVFQGFSNYLKTPFRTEHISLVNVSFTYLTYVNFKFNMNIDLNLYYANTYKESPVYRIRSKLLKKFQWWANDKNMWVVIAFAIFFYINTLIAFFSGYAHYDVNAQDNLSFIATFYANTITILNTYFIFAYFSSIFTFIYNYITIKRLIVILLTKNLKFNVSSKDVDLIYLIKMTNGYLVSIGLEDFLITINDGTPLTIDEYKNQMPLFKYSFFAHQRQLVNVFVARLIILGILTLLSWAITTAFSQQLNNYSNSIWWVIGCSAMLLINFAWSGLNVLDTIIPNPTNWIVYKKIIAYKPISIEFLHDYIVLKDMHGHIILNTKGMSNFKIRWHFARLFTNHVYSAKTYFVINDDSELKDIANYLFDHKVKMYVNYLFNDYLQKSLEAKSTNITKQNSIDLNKYFNGQNQQNLVETNVNK